MSENQYTLHMIIYSLYTYISYIYGYKYICLEYIKDLSGIDMIHDTIYFEF